MYLIQTKEIVMVNYLGRGEKKNIKRQGYINRWMRIGKLDGRKYHKNISFSFLRLWNFVNPLFPLCFLGTVLFLIVSTIVISLIPVYLPNRDFSQSILINYNSQTIILRLSSNSDLIVGEILDLSNRINVQNQVSFYIFH
jgi:hypothetical protein